MKEAKSQNDDIISRQAAIDAIFSEPLYESGMKKRDADAVVPAIYEKIKSLPSTETHEERTETHACDCIERQAVIEALEKVAELFPWRVPGNRDSYDRYNEAWNDAIGRAEIEIEELPSAQPEIIRCKDCKHFEYDHPYVIHGVPVLGHEVCNAWGTDARRMRTAIVF